MNIGAVEKSNITACSLTRFDSDKILFYEVSQSAKHAPVNYILNIFKDVLFDFLN